MFLAKKYFFIFLTILVINSVFSQKEDRIWYFGGDSQSPATGAGLDFNSGSPVTLTNSAMPYTEGSAVQCDRYGNLLFYTNGETVWNKNHVVMQNGTGLCGGTSSEQSAVVIPFPNDTNQFYLFANAGNPTAGGAGLFYSVINMTLNGGNGAVTNTKCMPLLGSTSEGLSATWHSNGIDYWVVTSQSFSSIMYSYLVSAAGISSPVISTLAINNSYLLKIDFNTKGDVLTLNSYKDSPIVSLGRIIAYFNQFTGVISNALTIDTSVANNGACFSPNDNILYYYGFNNIGFTLNQCDLNALDIPASKQVIQQLSFNYYTDMKLGPDGKIYCNQGKKDSLDRINNPNLAGLNCFYQTNAVYLGGKKSGDILPSRTFGKYIKPVGIKENYKNNLFSIAPNPASDLITLNTNEVEGVYTLYDSYGNKLLNGNFTSNDLVKIKLPSVSGIYFIVLVDVRGNRYTRTIIKE